MRFSETTFRPVFGRVLAGVVAALGAATVVVTALEGDVVQVLRVVPPVALVVLLVFAAFWLPGVTVRESGIEVRNVFSTFHVAWSSIRRIDTKWALTLVTDARTVNAWASPAPGRYASLGMTRGDVRGAAESARAAEGSIRPGDSLASESGAVAHVIRTHWEELRDDDRLDPPNAGTGPRREPHVATIVASAVLLVATVLTLAL